jgi:hypothetical protein
MIVYGEYNFEEHIHINTNSKKCYNLNILSQVLF